MNPQAKSPNDQFKPKWRHFHPQATLWVQNPFDHDVVFQVADEHNVPYQYRMPAGKVSELPGGAIATLGVKAIVDELIQKDKRDVFLMWDEATRRKHEDSIILRLKEAPVLQEISQGGEVNLVSSDPEFIPEDEEAEAAKDEPEVPFEDDEPAAPTTQQVDDGFGEPVVDPNPVAEDFNPTPVPERETVAAGTGLAPDPGITAVAEASLAGKDDATINEQ